MKIKQLLYPQRCKKCGKDLPPEQFILCPDCLAKGSYWLYDKFTVEGADAADAPLVYRDFVRGAMHAYKFQHRRAYADWFAQLAGDCLQGYLDCWKPDFITFVPLSWLRWMKRGYNQSGLAAKLVARRFALPCKRVLRKRAFVRVQSSLPHDARAQNIKGAFRLCRGAGLQGKRVLLIDDVITTGATAAECVRMLRAAGAEAVFVLSLTKTPVLRR